MGHPICDAAIDGNDNPCEENPEFILRYASGGSDVVYSCKRHLGHLVTFEFQDLNIITRL